MQAAKVQGHSLLAIKLAKADIARHVGWNSSTSQRLVSKLYRAATGLRENPESGYNAFVARFLITRERKSGRPVHLAWGDSLLTAVPRPERCIFTLHQPYEKWSEAQWAAIGRSGGILTMAERERDAIGVRFPHVVTEFIPHGVDTEFWVPGPEPTATSRPVVCAVGKNKINYPMMIRVAAELLRRHSHLHFRWLVNPDFFPPPELLAGLPLDRFQLCRNLSPEDYRAFFQSSTLFFTPYENVTASNAIVEAMACGLPVVTTRVGGMVSYGGNDALTMVADNDDVAALAAVERGLTDPIWAANWGSRARRYAQEHFAWSKVTAAHRQFYERFQRASIRNA